MQKDELDVFVERLLAEKALPGVSDEVKVQLVADLKQRLLDQINRALIDALPEEKLGAFNDLLDDEATSDDQVQRFVAESGVDAQAVTLETMLRFSELYLGHSPASED